MIKTLKTAAAAFAIALPLFAAGPAAAAELQLGTVSYDMRPQSDVLKVGQNAGPLKSIRFEVRQSSVEIINLQVVYGNGAPDNIDVKRVFKAGQSSRDIALQGGTRNVAQIIVTYRASGPAKIAFFGTPGQVGGNATWDRLGCKDVGFLVDRDVIKVGRAQGSYKAIRLSVRNAPIEMFNVRVVFGNGQAQDLAIRSVIPNGAQSRAIDLAGTNRGIDRIEMIYRSIPTFRGTANVCIDGLMR